MLRSLPVALALLVASAASGQAQRALSRTEQALVAHADREEARALALLEAAVNLNSGTLNFPGVRAVGTLFRAQFDSLGFTTTWVDGTAWGRAGHLVAVRRGRGPRVLLVGHLDTVFEPDSPFQRFERLDGNRARGPGIIDMKGGNVIIVQALRALAATRQLDQLHVTVVLTGDEERPGAPLAAARAALLEAAAGADLVLGFEDGDGDPAHLMTARRGSVRWTLETRGTPAHSSQLFQPDVGAGAIYEAARILDGFRTRLAAESLLTYNPGLILGGATAEQGAGRGSASGKDNIVAATTVVSGDLRAISPEQLIRAQAAMQELAAAHLPHTTATLTFDEGYPPMAPTAGNAQLLARYDAVSRDLGLGAVTPTDPRRAGAADVSFTAAVAPRVADALGLKGRDGHTAQETADLASLSRQVKRTAVLLARLITEPLTPPAAAQP